MKRRPDEQPQPSPIRAIDPKLGILVGLALLVATAAVYWQVGSHEFISVDDNVYITANELLQRGFDPDGVGWVFGTGYAFNWHPLTWLSHLIDYELYGLEPAGHHYTNLAFHLANTILLLLVLSRMTRAFWASLFVAGVFALHPLHVESVAWAAERKDVLSTFFWMLTLWGYARYVEAPCAGRYVLALSLFALGLMAKPMLVSLPIVLLLLDYWPLARIRLGSSEHHESGENKKKRRKRKKKRRQETLESQTTLIQLLREKIPFVVLALISSVLTFLAQKSGGTVVSIDLIPLGMRIENAFVSYVNYVVMALWPTGLAILYPHPGPTLSGWYALASAILLIAVTVAVLAGARRRPYLALGWLWYLITLVPVIGVVQVGEQALADRYMYVPLIGLSIMLAWGAPELLARLPARRVILTGSAVAVLAASAVMSWRQVGYWKDDLALHGHMLEVTRENAFAHYHLAYALHQRERYDEAAHHYRETIRIYPEVDDVHFGLARVLIAQQMTADAAKVLFERGVVLRDRGQIQESLIFFSLAVRTEPGFHEAQRALEAAQQRHF
jgi:tetratricopeptide (TPR) repeat protein